MYAMSMNTTPERNGRDWWDNGTDIRIQGISPPASTIIFYQNVSTHSAATAVSNNAATVITALCIWAESIILSWSFMFHVPVDDKPTSNVGVTSLLNASRFIVAGGGNTGITERTRRPFLHLCCRHNMAANRPRPERRPTSRLTLIGGGVLEISCCYIRLISPAIKCKTWLTHTCLRRPSAFPVMLYGNQYPQNIDGLPGMVSCRK